MLGNNQLKIDTLPRQLAELPWKQPRGWGGGKARRDTGAVLRDGDDNMKSSRRACSIDQVDRIDDPAAHFSERGSEHDFVDDSREGATHARSVDGNREGKVESHDVGCPSSVFSDAGAIEAKSSSPLKSGSPFHAESAEDTSTALLLPCKHRDNDKDCTDSGRLRQKSSFPQSRSESMEVGYVDLKGPDERGFLMPTWEEELEEHNERKRREDNSPRPRQASAHIASESDYVDLKGPDERGFLIPTWAEEAEEHNERKRREDNSPRPRQASAHVFVEPDFCDPGAGGSRLSPPNLEAREISDKVPAVGSIVLDRSQHLAANATEMQTTHNAASPLQPPPASTVESTASEAPSPSLPRLDRVSSGSHHAASPSQRYERRASTGSEETAMQNTSCSVSITRSTNIGTESVLNTPFEPRVAVPLIENLDQSAKEIVCESRSESSNLPENQWPDEYMHETGDDVGLVAAEQSTTDDASESAIQSASSTIQSEPVVVASDRVMLQRAVREIHLDTSLSEEERNSRCQALFSRVHIEREAKQRQAAIEAFKDRAFEKTYSNHIDPATGNPMLGCKHYARNCKLKAACCGIIVPCRMCHDDPESRLDHVFARFDTEQVLCMVCGCLQPVSNCCVKCQTVFAVYFCPKCKLYDNTPGKSIYHCDKCGICRIGKGIGIDNFHCSRCNVCVSLDSENTHHCLAKSLDANCPICNTYLLNSVTPVVFMRCGHTMHSSCFENYTKRHYTCPLCYKSLTDMRGFFQQIDRIRRRDIMPPELRNRVSEILCHDCNRKSVTAYHYTYHKCEPAVGGCGSYNTRVLASFSRENTSIANASGVSVPTDAGLSEENTINTGRGHMDVENDNEFSGRAAEATMDLDRPPPTNVPAEAEDVNLDTLSDDDA